MPTPHHGISALHFIRNALDRAAKDATRGSPSVRITRVLAQELLEVCDQAIHTEEKDPTP